MKLNEENLISYDFADDGQHKPSSEVEKLCTGECNHIVIEKTSRLQGRKFNFSSIKLHAAHLSTSFDQHSDGHFLRTSTGRFASSLTLDAKITINPVRRINVRRANQK
jgi:hypothetical protein